MKIISQWMSQLPSTWFGRLLNLWPPLLGAGIHTTYISKDFLEIEAKLKLHWYNKNYVGVHYGGSIFSLTDPYYMLILEKHLSKTHVVWDKAAKIDYIKPGRGTLTAKFSITPEELKTIREKTADDQKYLFDKIVEVKDEEGEVIASIVRTLYVRLKKPKV